MDSCVIPRSSSTRSSRVRDVWPPLVGKNKDMVCTESCPPILLLAFNRPDTTQRVLESLEAARPARIFLAVDGPRVNREGESARVAQVRHLAERIDWDCDVQTLFREQNLGCKLAVSQAISWFFSNVEAGIILEDDCVAHRSFFPYAAKLLERYRDDERVLMVSGDNFQRGRRRTEYSYYFSRYTHIWGWATWRRAWRLYDHEMTLWPGLRDGGWLIDILGDRKAAEYWGGIFEDTYQNRNTSWAYRWMFCAWAHGGLTVLPNVNLVSNIGFGDLATHTHHSESPWAALPVEAISLPLKHPPAPMRNRRADAFTQRAMFSSPPLWRRLSHRISRTMSHFSP